MCKLVECRMSKEYQDGFEEFIEFFTRNSKDKKTTRFPCKKCCNVAVLMFEEVGEHLMIHGIMSSYKICFPWREGCYSGMIIGYY
jgi:hypothetical protein